MAVSKEDLVEALSDMSILEVTELVSELEEMGIDVSLDEKCYLIARLPGNTDGTPMSEEDWNIGYARSLAVFLNGEAIPTPGPRGEQVTDDSFMVLFNAHTDPVTFTVPADLEGYEWQVLLDTSREITCADLLGPADAWEVEGWAVVLMQQIQRP